MITVNNAISLVSGDEFNAALAAAQHVDLTSFTLSPGKVMDTMEHSAEVGRDVHVTLSATGWAVREPVVRQRNLEAEAALTASGAKFDWNSDETQPLHAKFAILDGVAYGNERNWPDNAQTLVRFDDPRDVEVIRTTMAQQGAANEKLTTVHADALKMEAEQIRNTTGTPLDVETESFGDSPVSRALEARLAAGDHVRLMVVEKYLDKERYPALARLADAGAEIRLIQGFSSEKAAISPKSAWLGSTNIDRDVDGMLDWGTVTENAAVRAHLSENYEQRWSEAVPFADHRAALEAAFTR